MQHNNNANDQVFLKVAIVGFGVIATNGHLPTYRTRSNIRVTAIVDPVLSRRNEAQALIPGVKVYQHLGDLLRDCPQDVDIVDVCSPPIFHAKAVQEALEADKHVLCEKPVVTSKAELDHLVQLAWEHQRLLYPCHNYKFAPSIRYLSELISSGSIGIPVLGSFQISRIGCSNGVREWKPNWRKIISYSGGGIMVDHGTHAIYIAQMLLGSPPKRVSAFMGNLVHSRDFVEDTALFCLDFGDAYVQVNLTWVASLRKTTFIVYGTNGEARIEGDEVVLAERDKPLKRFIISSGFDDRVHTSWFQDMLQDFEHHLITRNFQPASLFEAAVTTQVIEQAYKSNANNGSWMSL